MAIFKAVEDDDFALIRNAALRDQRLSYEATGLLAMMLSLPHDWEIHKTWLEKQKVRCGRDKLTKMMKELIEHGYVVKKPKRQNGRLNGVDWLIYSKPQENSVQLETRPTENTVDGESATTNKEYIQIKTKTNTCLSVKDEFDEERIIPVWNSLGCKQHRMLTSKAAKALEKTYKAYVAERKKKDLPVSSLNDWLEAYLTKGFTKIMTNHHRENNDGNWAADLEFAVRFDTYEKVKNHVQ